VDGAFEVLDASLPVGSGTLAVVTTLDTASATDEITVTLESSDRAVNLSATPASGTAPYDSTFEITFGVPAFPLSQIDFDFDGDANPEVVASPVPVAVSQVVEPGLFLSRAFAYTPEGVELSAGALTQAFLPEVELARFAAGQNPVDLARDASGRLLVLDGAGGQIHRYTAAGVLIDSIASGGSGPGQLLAPSALTVASDGRIFVADTGNDRVQVFAADGSFDSELGGPGAAIGQFAAPRDVEAAQDLLYVADTGNDRVQIFSLEDGRQSAAGIPDVVAIGALGRDALLLATADGQVLEGRGFGLDGESVALGTPPGLATIPAEATLASVADLEPGGGGLLTVDEGGGQIVVLNDELLFIRQIATPSATPRAVLEGVRRETASLLVADGTDVVEVGLPVPSPVPALETLRDRLAAGDIEGALEQIHPNRRPLFRDIYELIEADLSAEAAAMSSFQIDLVRENRAIVYVERREMVDGVEMVENYGVTLIRGDGDEWFVYDY
jgi:hypothetical protein